MTPKQFQGLYLNCPHPAELISSIHPTRFIVVTTGSLSHESPGFIQPAWYKNSSINRKLSFIYSVSGVSDVWKKSEHGDKSNRQKVSDIATNPSRWFDNEVRLVDGFCQDNFAPSRHNQLFIARSFWQLETYMLFVFLGCKKKGHIIVISCLLCFSTRSGETTKLQPLGHFMQFVVDKVCFRREICSLVV